MYIFLYIFLSFLFLILISDKILLLPYVLSDILSLVMYKCAIRITRHTFCQFHQCFTHARFFCTKFCCQKFQSWAKRFCMKFWCQKHVFIWKTRLWNIDEIDTFLWFVWEENQSLKFTFHNFISQFYPLSLEKRSQTCDPRAMTSFMNRKFSD